MAFWLNKLLLGSCCCETPPSTMAQRKSDFTRAGHDGWLVPKFSNASAAGEKAPALSRMQLDRANGSWEISLSARLKLLVGPSKTGYSSFLNFLTYCLELQMSQQMQREIFLQSGGIGV